jgi:hypothetical protein
VLNLRLLTSSEDDGTRTRNHRIDSPVLRVVVGMIFYGAAHVAHVVTVDCLPEVIVSERVAMAAPEIHLTPFRTRRLINQVERPLAEFGRRDRHP